MGLSEGNDILRKASQFPNRKKVQKSSSKVILIFEVIKRV